MMLMKVLWVSVFYLIQDFQDHGYCWRSKVYLSGPNLKLFHIPPPQLDNMHSKGFSCFGFKAKVKAGHMYRIPPIYGPCREKTGLCEVANSTHPDQPAHSLISAFVIRFVESIICKLSTGKISIF